MFIKNAKWLVASAAALGLGLAAIPFMSNSVGGTAAPTTAAAAGESDKVKAATEAGVCTAKPKTAPLDFVVKDMNGADVKLADYKGKVVMLNFWATWCGPCRAEIPALVELQDKYADQLVVLGLSVDDTAEKLRPYAEEFKMNYPVVQMRPEVENAWGPFYGYPTSFIVARDGSICTKHIGPASHDQFESEIRGLL